MMTTKKFNARMAEAAQKNRKNTVIASSVAGATGLVASAIVFVVGHHKNNKIDKEIDNLRNDITTLDAAVTTTADILAATTTTAVANNDTDTKTNVKYAPINIYGFAGAINNKMTIYTKTVTDTVEFAPVANASLETYEFQKKYYITETDHKKLYPTTEEKTEEKTDDKK